MFTNELSLRLGSNSNVSVYSLHPGVIRTELLRYAGEGLFFLLPYLLIAFSPIFMIFTKSPSEGAQTTIHCAVSEDAYEYKGCYFRYKFICYFYSYCIDNFNSYIQFSAIVNQRHRQ